MGMLANPAQPVELVADNDGVIRRRQSMAFVGAVSRTKQEFVAEADINNIIKRYRVTGLMRQLPREPMFGDFTNIPSYQESLNVVIRGQEAFARLPSDLRTRFNNDPSEFLAFMANPDNRDEIYELGLAKRPAPSDTDKIVSKLDELKPAKQASEGAPAPVTK